MEAADIRVQWLTNRSPFFFLLLQQTMEFCFFPLTF